MRILPALAIASAALAQENWPMFRGAAADGLGSQPAPVSFHADPETGPPRGIRWKVPLPGLGHSSPVVWGHRLFVASAVAAAGKAPLKVGLYGAGDSAEDNGEQSWKIFCFDKRDGRLLWERTAHQGIPRAKRHTKATHANTTVATDGKRLVALFGSEGLFAYSLDGKLLWKKDLGVLDMAPFNDQSLSWGFASSPVLFEDKVVVQADRKRDPFVAVFAAADGKELWRTARGEIVKNSWATPAVVRTPGRTQVVLNGYPYIAGYDFATGKELWRLKSEGDIPVPTPVFAHGLIYVTNAHGGPAPLYAIRPEATGDITPAGGSRSSAGVAWSEPRNGAYMQTPLVLGDLLYSCSDRGVLKVFDARTGQLHYQQRLGAGTTGFSASPVAAGGRLYFTSEEGEVYVVAAGTQFELVATNRLGEIVMASPAVSGGVLYFRTRGHVVAVGEAR
jgi:outer membrane protein assembly factor BamB